MSKLLIAVIALGVGGALVYFVLYPPAAEAPSEDRQTVANEEVSPVTVSDDTAFPTQGTLATLFARGDSATCTFTTIADDVATDGTVWYDANKFALEGTTRVNGELYVTNMINDGTRTYTWSGTSGGMMAIVRDNDDTMVASDVTAATPDSGFDPNVEATYDCRAWTPDPLRFVPPSTITFTDFNDVMQGMFEGALRGAPEGMDF